MDARPLLWVRSATLALMAGQTTGVEEKLLAAEISLQKVERDVKTRDLIGQIAAPAPRWRSLRYEPQTIYPQSRRALEYLPPDNLIFLFTASWALGSACLLQGDRAAAAQAYRRRESARRMGVFSKILATFSWAIYRNPITSL